MQKSRIEVCTNIVAQSEAQKLAQLAVDNWHNQGAEPYNNDIDNDNK